MISARKRRGQRRKRGEFLHGAGYSVTQSSSYNASQNYLTPVGSFTGAKSFYGTYDQSGDIWNWNSTVVSSQYPVMRGGGWDFDSDSESSAIEGYDSAGFYSFDVGFRVASVPEPSTRAMMALGATSLSLFHWRRSKFFQKYH